MLGEAVPGESGCTLCFCCGWSDDVYLALNYELKAWGYSPVVEQVLSMSRSLGSLSRTTRRKQTEILTVRVVSPCWQGHLPRPQLPSASVPLSPPKAKHPPFASKIHCEFRSLGAYSVTITPQGMFHLLWPLGPTGASHLLPIHFPFAHCALPPNLPYPGPRHLAPEH